MSATVTTSNAWRKSTYSGGSDGSNCVEIADRASHIAIRDSKRPALGTLRIGPAAFAPFIQGLRHGQLT
ncbi:DUF397 domain-containing protein [Streptomyces sp. NPDC004610]|uniref:DUF397 domain-containing protein n=1 Tax=unclassified Streptomyces TaxID=2593676 RepID=UPI0033BB770F